MYAALLSVFPLACDVWRFCPPVRNVAARRLERTIHEEAPMNWAQAEGKWKQYSGKVKEKWGKLTDDDLDVIRGRRDQLIGKIQERYGILKQEAERQVDEFARSFSGEDVTQDSNERSTSQEKRRSAGQS
jgi:uncharacterized protein YjbJ (UPF0337 family)